MPLSNTANAASLLTTPLFFNRDDPYARNAWNLYVVWVLSFDSRFGFSEFGSGFEIRAFKIGIKFVIFGFDSML